MVTKCFKENKANWCGGLNANVVHCHICLKAWYPISETFWGDLGGMS